MMGCALGTQGAGQWGAAAAGVIVYLNACVVA